METEITPMLLRPASDTVIAQSRLWGDETVGDKTDRAEVFSPLTFSSLSYSKYCWQDFWAFCNSVRKPDNKQWENGLQVEEDRNLWFILSSKGGRVRRHSHESLSGFWISPSHSALNYKEELSRMKFSSCPWTLVVVYLTKAGNKSGNKGCWKRR